MWTIVSRPGCGGGAARFGGSNDSFSGDGGEGVSATGGVVYGLNFGG